MARFFSRAGTASVQFDVGPLSADLNVTKTYAAVCRPGTLGAGVSWATLIALNFAGAAATNQTVGHVFFGDYPPHPLYYKEGYGIVESSITADSTAWQLVVVDKTTAITNFHQYSWATGTWTHDLGDTSLDQAGALGAGGVYAIGVGPGPQNYYNGDIAAVATWPRVLSTGEIERLARGNWTLTGPEFHVEFPRGDPGGAGTVRSIGRIPLQQTVTAGTSLTAATDPPGFRFSALNWRR